jgi:hypothetical protein
MKMTKGILRLIKKESNLDFEIKKSKNDIEYVTMNKAEQAETIKDIRLIFKKFNLTEYSKYIRIDKFETQLSKLTYNK